jgi:hypothetical protein
MMALFTNTGTKLPSAGSRTTLEGTGYVRSDPAAIEVTFLWLNTFPVDEATVNAVGIECQMIAQDRIRCGGRRVPPSGSDRCPRAGMKIPVAGLALVLAKATMGVRPEKLHPHIRLWNVVGGRMACFE